MVGQPAQQPHGRRGTADAGPRQAEPVTAVESAPPTEVVAPAADRAAADPTLVAGSVGLAEPTGPAYVRGVASVPAAPRRRWDDSGALPYGGDEPARARVPEPPRGMVVRRRWRQLRAGAGWSWTGGSFVVVCWGVWAVSLRGGDLLGPVLALALVFATAGLVFTVSRLLGRAVLENMLGRQRRSAWPSHMAAGTFLILSGLAFLQQTWWIANGWRWLTEHLLP